MSTSGPPILIFETHDVVHDNGSYRTLLDTIQSSPHLQTLISGLTLTQLLPTVAVLYVCGMVSVVLYRLFFHPISRFPGPRIAAATGWYQAYYDIWKRGTMTQNTAKLHEIYGEFF